MECGHGQPFAGQEAVEHVWSVLWWGFAHHLQAAVLGHRRVWWPNCWQLAHWVVVEKRSLRSDLKVVVKAEREAGLAKSWAFAPVAMMTMDEASFPARLSSVVSPLGSLLRASPGL